LMAFDDFHVKPVLTSLAFTLVYDWFAAHVASIADVRKVINLLTLSRCSKFLLHLNRFGLSLSRKETKPDGSFQIDIPCIYPSSRNGTQQSEGSRSQTCPSLALAA
jgi:hypothetical protein